MEIEYIGICFISGQALFKGIVMIKAVMVDLDGTLLNDNKEISKHTVDTILEFQEKGGLFVVNTGRGYATASKFLKEVGISCDYICLSGAATYTADGACVMQDVMDKKEVEIIRNLEKKYHLYVNYLTSKGALSEITYEMLKGYYLHEAHMREAYCDVSEGELLKPYANILSYVQYEINIDEVIAEGLPIYKMVLMSMDLEVLEEVKKELAQYSDFAVAWTSKSSCEVNASRVNKGQAALVYMVAKDIDMQELMVIGDSENDISMLKMSFGKTVAMANADESIKNICSDVTLSNNEDGVAYAMEQWAWKE